MGSHRGRVRSACCTSRPSGWSGRRESCGSAESARLCWRWTRPTASPSGGTTSGPATAGSVPRATAWAARRSSRSPAARRLAYAARSPGRSASRPIAWRSISPRSIAPISGSAWSRWPGATGWRPCCGCCGVTTGWPSSTPRPAGSPSRSPARSRRRASGRTLPRRSRPGPARRHPRRLPRRPPRSGGRHLRLRHGHRQAVGPAGGALDPAADAGVLLSGGGARGPRRRVRPLRSALPRARRGAAPPPARRHLPARANAGAGVGRSGSDGAAAGQRPRLGRAATVRAPAGARRGGLVAGTGSTAAGRRPDRRGRGLCRGARLPAPGAGGVLRRAAGPLCRLRPVPCRAEYARAPGAGRPPAQPAASGARLDALVHGAVACSSRRCCSSWPEIRRPRRPRWPTCRAWGLRSPSDTAA